MASGTTARLLPFTVGALIWASTVVLDASGAPGCAINWCVPRTDGTSLAQCGPQPAGDSRELTIDRRTVKQIIERDNTAYMNPLAAGRVLLTGGR
jgi:hypothetical protein